METSTANMDIFQSQLDNARAEIERLKKDNRELQVELLLVDNIPGHIEYRQMQKAYKELLYMMRDPKDLNNEKENIQKQLEMCEQLRLKVIQTNLTISNTININNINNICENYFYQNIYSCINIYNYHPGFPYKRIKEQNKMKL